MAQNTLNLTPNPQLIIEDSQTMDARKSPSNLSQTSLGSQDSCHLEDAEPRGVMEVVVRPAPLKRAVSNGRNAMPAYSMESKPRGVAHIIAIEKYVNEVREERHGSEVDRKNLKSLFEELHFSVEQTVNPTRPQLYDDLIKFASDKRHLTADMMVLIVLSHGKEGVIETSDGQTVDIERIFSQFNNQECPNLKGKLKFFIVQVSFIFSPPDVAFFSNATKRPAFRLKNWFCFGLFLPPDGVY